MSKKFARRALSLAAFVALSTPGGAALAQGEGGIVGLPAIQPTPERSSPDARSELLQSRDMKWIVGQTTGPSAEYMRAGNFIECALIQGKKQTESVLGTVNSSPQEKRSIDALTRLGSGCPSLGQRFSTLFVRGAAAEALVARSGKSAGLATSGEHLTRFEASRKQMPATMPGFVRWQEIADCQVRFAPSSVQLIMAHAPGSKDEAAAIESLIAGTPNCANIAPPDDVSRPAVRALLAEALYRWITAE
jgi:hypothetical protein